MTGTSQVTGPLVVGWFGVRPGSPVRMCSPGHGRQSGPSARSPHFRPSAQRPEDVSCLVGDRGRSGLGAGRRSCGRRALSGIDRRDLFDPGFGCGRALPGRQQRCSAPIGSIYTDLCIGIGDPGPPSTPLTPVRTTYRRDSLPPLRTAGHLPTCTNTPAAWGVILVPRRSAALQAVNRQNVPAAARRYWCAVTPCRPKL